MTRHIGFLIFFAAVCIRPTQGQDQTEAVHERTSAKEMFLNPRQMPYGVQDEAPPVAKTTPKSRAKAKPKPKAAEAVPTEKNQPARPANAAVSENVESEQPAGERPAQIIRASYSGVPLGLRYTLRKREGDQMTDVPGDTEFHAGDRIQLNLEVNDSGYLYIIQQGTSGKWEALFPSPEVENGDNRVQRGHVYSVPPGHVFTFSGAPGVERLFVIFSRQPVEEIDTLIYSLKGGRRTPTAAPGGERLASPTLMASARPIEDSRIAEMRVTYSRDLIIEKGEDEPAGQHQGGAQPDMSVYVVNPKGSADSRVVADIPLIHK